MHRPQYIDPRFLSGHFRPAQAQPRPLVANGLVGPLYPLCPRYSNACPAQPGIPSCIAPLPPQGWVGFQ